LDHPDTLTETEIIGELRHVSKSYSTDGGREYKVLDQIDLAVREGELLALLGQSGSGKSTILRCLTGLLKPTAGRVLCYGKPLDGIINPHASVVFQTFALYPWLKLRKSLSW
jgi:NitT/TauT family transport system ATP-binding protein